MKELTPMQDLKQHLQSMVDNGGDADLLCVIGMIDSKYLSKENDLTIKFGEWCLVEFLTSLNTGVDAKADNIEELLQIFKEKYYNQR